MRSRVSVVETEESVITRAPVTVRAPALARVADALFQQAQNPADRRAKISVALLEKQGALDCPSCGARFVATGYRETHTAFSMKRSLQCTGCRTCFVVEEEELS